MFDLQLSEAKTYDVAVLGGGIAGTAAAISAARAGARVILIERGGSLGGTLTEGFMPILLDSDNKGGIVRELYSFLDEHGMTCARKGNRTDSEGKRIAGQMVDTEGCKIFLDKACREAGVKVLFYSQVAAADMKDGAIEKLLIVTECQNFSLQAKVYIDATGSGLLSHLAGCKWDCGDPHEGRPSPTSMGVCVVGMPEDYNGTDNAENKAAYGKMLESHGIKASSGLVSVTKLPSLSTWDMGTNFQYDVMPNDIEKLSDAVLSGRNEIFEIMEAHKKIPGYEKLYTVFTSTHIGIREGRRIYGEYRITDDDILDGRRFEDGICLVTAGVDVHRLKKDDTDDCGRGYRAKPFHIPYRALIPKGVENLLLAGRCLSGDFYPHAAYRMMGNMAATGEAAGFAAAECAKKEISPISVCGKSVRAFMESRGYDL